jgi:CcmD family protein
MSRWKSELKPWGIALLAAIALAIAAGGPAFAQAQDGFQNVGDITRESLPAGPLVYIAYALVWLALIGYVFLLWRRLDRIERELKDVSARLASGKRA